MPEIEIIWDEFAYAYNELAQFMEQNGLETTKLKELARVCDSLWQFCFFKQGET